MNEPIECYMENVVISRDDLYINFDKFTSGKSNIILITGFSGSGKTTLAKELAQKYKCADYIELDALDWWFNHTITEDELKSGVPVCYDFLQQHPQYKELKKKPLNEEYHKIYRIFIPYVISWCKKRKENRYVIEGLQLYESLKKGETPSYIKEPMVLRGTSGLKSIYRAMKRNGASLKDIPGYLQWYISTNRQVEDLYKAMKKEYDKEEPTMESYDPILSFLDKYGDSSSVFEESGNKTRYNDKHEKVPDTCTKCGGEIGIFIQGEPVYLCKNCKEYYGTVPFPTKKKSKSVQESAESEYSYTKLSSDSELKDYRDCMKTVFHSKDVFTDSQAKKWMYVIKYKNEVIGFIGFSHYIKKGRKLLGLGNFMIKPEYQDSGHGTNFIKYLIDKNKDECDEIYCYVEKKNTRAIEFYKKIGDVNTKNLTKYGYYVCLYKKEDEVMESFDEASLEFDDAFFEEALKDTTILRDRLYPKVEECLKVPANVKKLKKIISDFVEKNTDKLTTPGPQYLIVFGDQDKDLYYKLFEMKKEEVLAAMKDVVKETGSKSDFKYLLGNPFLALLYYIIRYFTYHKDEKALNGCLSMFAIDVYWSIFTKYFPNGVLEPFMNYTIDNLTDKFIIKKAGTIFAALTESARRSYGFHESKIKSGNDAECVSFMQRIRNDQNSMFRTLSQIYYKNYKEGNAIATRNDNYDPSNPIIDDVRTSSTEIQSVVDKTCMPMITNGIDIVLAEAAARMSNISITNLRIYLTKIFVSERLTEITQLVESMIFLFVNESRRSVREIKSQYFLYWSAALFKKTNSKDGNIIRINAILDKWGTVTGIYETFRSEGSRINYKKAIFLYIAMSVQKYT